MSYMPDPKAKPASTDPKRGKYVAKPAPKPVYAGVHVGKPKPPVSEAIHSPFTRDAYPALTDAIRGVVNGQPREVEEDFQTPERAREMSALKKKLKHEADRDSAAAWRAGEMGTADEADAAHNKAADSAFRQMRAHTTDAKEREDRKNVYGKGGKVVASGVKLKSKSGGKVVREDIQTPERDAELRGKIKKLRDKASYHERSSRTPPPSVVRGEVAGADHYFNQKDKQSQAIRKANTLYDKQARERKSKKTYGLGGKVVRESQELDERIIDEVDAFQAAKNWVKGKGFKTNREVSYAKVQKNYEAMKKRQAAEAKNKYK